jgi:hypothetical protein
MPDKKTELKMDLAMNLANVDKPVKRKSQIVKKPEESEAHDQLVKEEKVV